MSNVLEPSYEREVVEYAKWLDAQMTPQQREQYERERRIEEKWETLKAYVERKVAMYGVIRSMDARYRCEAYRDVLGVMERLERGDAIE